jgi:CBS domain-containing protein
MLKNSQDDEIRVEGHEPKKDKKEKRSADKQEVLAYLRKMPHFSMLPAHSLDVLADKGRSMSFQAGELLATLGETSLRYIYVIRKGKVSIHNEREGRNLLVGHIVSGEVFGGVSVLMNGGTSLRTVYVEEPTLVHLIPRDIFLDLCSQYRSFSTFFLENFSTHITDAALDTIVNSGLAKIFLLSIAPFSFLPESDVNETANAISMERYSKGSFLFLQGQSKVSHLYILHKGSARSYYEQNGNKNLLGVLEEGDMYGGISMLLNDDLAVRTLEALEDSYFYLIPRENFFSLCEAHSIFRDFFTDIFGKQMLDKSYAAIISRTTRSSVDESSQLFNLPVSHICNSEPVMGTLDMTIKQVAMRMQEESSSYLMLHSDIFAESGIITESDLTRKVIASGYDINRPASEVMSAPLHTIYEKAMVFEAFMKMMHENVQHLAVDNGERQIVGVLSSRELLSAQSESPLIILTEIASAETSASLKEQHEKLPVVVKGLISRGVAARNINRMITTVSDAILNKILETTLAEMAHPPVPFAFIIMGSEGRGEQTLKTDQDNAIIFEDVSEAELPEVSQYFLDLGQRVCKRLNDVGYDFCRGDVMAQNPNWCQPLSVWMKYFLKWIYASEPEDILHSSIFFDFRFGYGDEQLVHSLRDHLFGLVGKWQGFLRYMVDNAMYFKPPLGLFRNFVVESKGEHRNSLNVKIAMTPIVDFARIYTLKNGIKATNTFERIEYLCHMGALSQAQYEELEKSYAFLMQLRMERQVTALIDEKKEADNFINPKGMTHIEQTMLKEIFKRISSLQSQMCFEFTGTA